MTKPCLGVVLTGGRSRRMGCDKASLFWRGRSLIEHAIARFTEAGINDVVVSGAHAEHVAIPDLHPGNGPLAGIFAVAHARPECRLLVVPIDMPKLPASLLKALVEAEPESTALHFEAQPMPLRIDANLPLRTLLASWLAQPSGPRALRHLLREIGAKSVFGLDPLDSVFENANTPQDWKRISA